MTNKMSSMKIAIPYAKAFFELGLSLYFKGDDPDILYKLIFDFQYLLKLFEEIPELKSFLQNPLNSIEIKKSVLNKCLDKKLNFNTKNFLNLLIDKKRIIFIDSIGKKFLEKSYDFIGIKFVNVWSTIKLNSKQQKALINKSNYILKSVFTEPNVKSTIIQLTLRIDKKILGGLVIKIGSKVLDLSLRGELQNLGKELNIVL